MRPGAAPPTRDFFGGADGVPLRNRAIAECLALEAEKAKGHVQRAFRRASSNAILWTEEASDILAAGRSLTELRGIGPFLARVVRGWIEAGTPPAPPPPIRSGYLTVCDARRAFATDPTWPTSCQGDLQTHTTWSDGSDSVADMAKAALERGYRYVGITDHSNGQPIPPGIGPEGLEAQRLEIEAANAELAPKGLRVLRSMEMNLKPTGEGDVDPAALARLDLVLGAFHSALRRTEDQTDRYLAGVRNPTIHVLAHPRCRMRGVRLGLSADWRRVFAEAARLDKAIECDGDPWRQDLDLSLLELAREEGCRVSLGSDAHATGDLRFLEIALGATLLAGIPRERIVNFLPADDVVAWATSVRGQKVGKARVRATRTEASPRPRGSRRATPRSRGRAAPGTS